MDSPPYIHITASSFKETLEVSPEKRTVALRNNADATFHLLPKKGRKADILLTSNLGDQLSLTFPIEMPGILWWLFQPDTWETLAYILTVLGIIGGTSRWVWQKMSIGLPGRQMSTSRTDPGIDC